MPETQRSADSQPQVIETTLADVEDEFSEFKDANSDSEADGDSSDDEKEDTLNGLTQFFRNDDDAEKESIEVDAGIPAEQEKEQTKNRRKYIEEKVYRLLGVEPRSDTNIQKFEGWLGKEVLLQGRIFLTKKYFLFIGLMPPLCDYTVMSGPLAKKNSGKIPILGQASYTRHWFVLRRGTFTWYNNAADIYFPLGVICLDTVLSVETLQDEPEKFVIKCKGDRTFRFRADSRNAAHQWCSLLKKEIFKLRNQDDDDLVTVRIPLENLIYAQDDKVLDLGRLLTLHAVPLAYEASHEPVEPSSLPVSTYKFMFFGDGKESFLLADALASLSDDFANHKKVLLQLNNSKPDVDYEHSSFGSTTEPLLDSVPGSELRFFDDFSDDSKHRVDTPSLSAANLSPQKMRSLFKSKEDDSESGTIKFLSPFDLVASQRAKIRSFRPSNLSKLTRFTKKLSFGSKEETEDSSEGSSDSGDDEFEPRFAETRPDENLNTDESSENEEDADSDDEKSELEPEGIRVESHRKFSDYHKALLAPYNLAKRPIMSYRNSSNRLGLSRSSSHRSVSPSKSPKKTLSPSKSSDWTLSPSKSPSKSEYSPNKARLQNPPQAPDASDVESEDNVIINEWFRSTFGLDRDVKLFAEYVCSISNPNQSSTWIGESSSWSGRLFVSDQYLCFKRDHAITSRWRVVVPLKDIIHISDAPSNGVSLEVSETAYENLNFTFSTAELRKDIKETLDCAMNLASQESRNSIGQTQEDVTAEKKYLDYTLRTARLSTYEPVVASRLRHKVPPMIFDPDSAQYKEAFLRKPAKSLKFAMLMIGSRGDVQPYIALSQGLMAEGHECLIITHKEFREWVESFGIEFCEIAGDPSELMELMISHGSISYGFVKDALAHFKGWIKELMSTSWKAVKHSHADVLIESPSSMIGIHLAEALNIPYFRAFTMPWTRTKAYPQALVSSDQNRNGAYNAITYTMYDRLVWFCISSYVNKWRKKHLKLPATNLDCMSQQDVPFLYCVSPTVLAPPLDQFDWVHTCGYWNLRDVETNKEKQIDPKVKEFMARGKDRGKKLVYIGFGSIIVSDPDAMTQTVIEATKQAGVYCILARGWSSRSADKEHHKQKPIEEDHIFEVKSIDHQWLFPRVDVCVHHGGCGTTGASLTAGKPTIIKPFFGDQFFYASRVEDLHVGVHLKNLNTDRLREALEKCCTDAHMIRQASVVGCQISHENGVDEAIMSIYTELDYATDVTHRRRRETKEYAESGLFPDTRSFIAGHVREIPKLNESWLSLPSLGRREAHRKENSKNSSEVDVSL